MNRTETTAIMTAIKAAYPNYYKSKVEIDDAINIWAEMLEDDDTSLIARAVKDFIKTDASGFPPTIGQIRGRAAEIRRVDWNKKKREEEALPEPAVNAVPMPDELRKKIESWLGAK